MATSRGKIGRLPADLRNQVNAMIRDNKTAERIIAFLESKKVRGVSPQNISNWKAAGYTTWIRRQERLEEMAGRRDFAVALVAQAAEAGDANLSLASDTASALAVDMMLEVLEEFDPGNLKGLLQEKPDKVFGMLQALSSIRTRDQAGVELNMRVREARRLAERARAAADSSGNVDLAKLADEMDRVLGG